MIDNDQSAPLPFPGGTPGVAKPRPQDENPRTAPLGTMSEEALAFLKSVAAMRAALKLVEMRAGRAIAVCTSGPVRPNQAEAIKKTHPADGLAFHAGELLVKLHAIDNTLFNVQAETENAAKLAARGELRNEG